MKTLAQRAIPTAEREPAASTSISRRGMARSHPRSPIELAIHGSPRLVAQRKQLRAAFGSSIQLESVPPENHTPRAMPPSVAQSSSAGEGEATPRTCPGLQAGGSVHPSANRTGLPDVLKAGIESLSGVSMDGVRVHFNSSRPAQLQALAYAQGSDIHLAPGQERHLPHEAWHVVQQARGEVAPTMRLENGIPVNDSPALERAADQMGVQAVRMGNAGVVGELPPRTRALGGDTIQRVRGGLEYTEGGTTALTSYPVGAPPVAAVPVASQVFGATMVEAYRVPDLQMGVWVGGPRNTDHEVMRNSRVKLTNDVASAEWVIEGHAVAGLDARRLIAQTLQDVGLMFGFRRALRAFVTANTMVGHQTVLAPDGHNSLAAPGPQGLFVYRADNASSGKVQITAQYTNVDTIRRINELNASKYLSGTKVPEGRDTDRVAGSRGWLEQYGDWKLTTSSATATALYGDLLGLSVNLAAGGGNLTAAESALVKLMVVNDAMASNMSRHAALIGQAQEKNIQRFFPKAERQTYVHAVARAALPAALLTALRLDIVANQAAMAQAVWNRADPFALTLGDSIRERTAAAATLAVLPGAVHADATLVAPGLLGLDVTAAINAIGPAVATAVAEGVTKGILVDFAAQEIEDNTTVVDPDATAIATVVVDAAIAARDQVTLAMLPLLAAQHANAAGQATTPVVQGAIKDLVLGVNGAQLAAWIGRAARAYTDATGVATDHVDPVSGTGNVIRSTQGYTPVAGGGQGAIYEFREREIAISDGNTGALEHALANLFGAAD